METAFEVAQRSTPYVRNGKPTDLWDWSVWITPRRGAGLDAILRVVYSLHPAFPNPNRIVHARASGFRLDVSSGNALDETWGTFTIRVRILIGAGGRVERVESHEVALRLAGTGGLLDLPVESSLQDHLTLVKRLKAKGAFGYAREALDRARAHPDYATDRGLREKLIQQQALCTYKDPLLPLDTRLARALRVLDTCHGTLRASVDPETLGIAGAIHKRLWEVDRQRENLERSFAFYKRGYEEMLKLAGTREYDGGGYAGVNAAFVADLLHEEECRAGSVARGTGPWAGEALRIRSALVQSLSALQSSNWWHHASLAEAHLGLGHTEKASYDEATAQLAQGMSLPDVPDWERESTAKQLSTLVELHDRLYHPNADAARAREVVSRLLPENREALWPPVAGKVGLALSGGGFRASLYHIGVLARLAELDLLRHVEVLSCVSGGSIVGAHYYLELRRLLQTKTDDQITRTDYTDIVRRLEEDFLAGVQANIRMRVAGSFIANWQMLLRPSRYSRTRRIGELYEDYIFSRVKDDEGPERWLNDLFISPREGAGAARSDGFSPKLHNWRRCAKVPVLVLNATTLNTGRNWQFTASSMGEPGSYGDVVDATERFDAVYYSEAPEAHRGVRLGHAVAASSCVPGLFDPLVLEGLYGPRVVRLVDGGVHDNQGTRALLDHDCTVLLVSDASGQMETVGDPSNASVGVLLRTNTVLQARLRVAQHQEIEARRRSKLVRDEMLVHLKQDLEAPVVSAGAAVAPPDPTAATTYGVRKDMQAALASIRTDLDSFTEREAYALMTSGYRATERNLGRLAAFTRLPDAREAWRFLAVERALRGEANDVVDPRSLLRHLKVGSRLGFKVWSLHPVLRVVGWLILLASAGGLVAAALKWSSLSFTIAPLGLLISAAVFGLGFLSRAAGRAADLVMKIIHYKSTIGRAVAGLVMGTVGAVLVWIHIEVFDRLFKFLGRVSDRPMKAAALPPETGARAGEESRP